MLFSLITFAQPPTVSTSVDKKNILIGDQLHFRVTTSMPDNTYRLSWFNLSDSIGNFRVVQESKIDSTQPNGQLNFSQEIILTCFDSGRQVIPPLTLNFQSLEGDSSFNLLTDSIIVNASFSPMDSVTTFNDIKSIIEVKKTWPWWWWALLGVGLILLIFWIRFLIKFFKRKKEAPDYFKAKLSPLEEAIQSLSDLEKEQLLQQHQTKEFHLRLTEIFKRYLSRKTNIYKMQYTSDEILMDINEYGLNKEQLSSFAGILRMSNAVKFAKYIPPDKESENCLLQTRDIISEINKNLNKKPESDS